jgi:ABC-type nitrate/sulfonate/bicarbonate transport system substrate-binding protein
VIDNPGTRSRLRRRPLARAAACTAAVAAAALALAACSSSSSSSSSASSGSSASASGASSSANASSTSVTTVTIGVNAAVAGEIEPVLAEQAGLFAKYNIKANVSVIPASTLLAALASGKVQFGAFGAPQPEEAAMSGAQLKWLAVWENKPNTALVAAPGITSIADLKGKSIGITVPGSLTDIFSRLALGRGNVSPSDVTYAPLQSTSSELSAFAAGSVQATILSPPQSTTALKDRKGSTALIQFGQFYSWPQGGLVGYMPFVDSHQTATTEVLEGIAAAVNLYRSDPAAAEKAIQSVSSSLSGPSLTASYQSALSTLATSTIAPSLTTEKFVLSTLQSLYPGKYPKAVPSFAASMIDTSFATAATQKVGIQG